MKIYFPNSRSYKCGLTLFELVLLVACVAVAANFSIYMKISHHWFLGILAFPLGFFSAMYLICSVIELATRYGHFRAKCTPSALIWRSLRIGMMLGMIMGCVFYYLGVRGIIPTVAGNEHRLLLSACLFGTSVALTIATILYAPA